MTLTVKYTEQKPVPEGMYVARLDGLEPVNNQYGNSIKWIFTIQAPQDFVGTQVTGMSSTKVSPKSKMFGWLQAFGVVLNPDETFDAETLLGRMCQIRVKNKHKKVVVDGRERETVFSNVDAIATYIPASPPTYSTPQYSQHPTQSQNLQPNPPAQNNPVRPQPTRNPLPNNTVSSGELNPDEEFNF